MRIGENPEKSKGLCNELKWHRVIVVFYIPNLTEDYYKEALIILDKSLQSLVDSVNFKYTAITLINNNSCNQVNELIKEKYIEKIDKYVHYSENKGKVYAVINEARAVYEPFVTITDSDVLFLKGWDSAIFDIYENFPDVAVVSPMPSQYLTFYNNESTIGSNFLFNRIKFGKYVQDVDVDLYIKGTNLPELINRPRHNTDWKQKQYVLKKNNVIAVIGAYHITATYRSAIFKNFFDYPFYKFKNSYEELFIDSLANRMGFWRLSTNTTFVYHMGNRIDENVEILENKKTDVGSYSDFSKLVAFKKKSLLSIFFRRIIGKIAIKYYYKK